MKNLILLLSLSALSAWAHTPENQLLQTTVPMGPLCYTLPDFSENDFECSSGLYTTGYGARCDYAYQYQAVQNYRLIIAEAGKPIYELDYTSSAPNSKDLTRESGYRKTNEEAVTGAKAALVQALRSFVASKKSFACKD